MRQFPILLILCLIACICPMWGQDAPVPTPAASPGVPIPGPAPAAPLVPAAPVVDGKKEDETDTWTKRDVVGFADQKPTPIKLPSYRCHKVVGAAKITGVEGATDTGTVLSLDGLPKFPVSDGYVTKYGLLSDLIGGYLVVYEDGYQSWSPAKAFEDGYTLLVEGDTPESLARNNKEIDIASEVIALRAQVEHLGAEVEAKNQAHAHQMSRAGQLAGKVIDLERKIVEMERDHKYGV